MQELLDEILFEKRNKEYGSYKLRKGYFSRLAISFIVALTTVLLFILGYFYFLNTGGDSTVYLYSYSNPGMKSAQSSLMDPADLAALMSQQEKPDEKVDQPVKKPVDVLHDFTVTEKPTPDTFIQKEEQEEPEAAESGGLSTTNDSTIFGGYLLGPGDEGGGGSGLDKFPEFPGGTDAVRRYIELTVTYPLQAIKQKLNGVVILSFDVNRQGAVDNIKVERGVHPMLDKEAIKAVENMPRWKPGVRHGKPVIVKFVIPVRFMPVS
jgi:periplasmic protein TonB